jgi:hypothetical protein
MTTIPKYPDFESAYLDQLERVYKEPQFTNPPRGNPSREILSLAYRMEDPRERAVRRAARRTNLHRPPRVVLLGDVGDVQRASSATTTTREPLTTADSARSPRLASRPPL